MNNVYILLEIARWDRTGEVLQLLVYASKALYLFLKANRGALVRLRDSWLTMRVKSDAVVVYRDWRGRIHRRDGPAVSCRVRGDYWLCHGFPHRGDGLPAHTDPLDSIRELTDRHSLWFWKGQIFHTRPDFELDPKAQVVFGSRGWLLDSLLPGSTNFFDWWTEYCVYAFDNYYWKNRLFNWQTKHAGEHLAWVKEEFEVDVVSRRHRAATRAYQPPKPHWASSQRPRSPAYLGGVTGRMRRR